ncbi:hypothetical protein CMV_016795 [Castanea mollissima]|uniref:Uncharacterized protein n=1 Tax=Castanea mollissima TaxID=60419 RepID=A0A8J4VJ20_9ROSI|nr:hypothetical protein CMV_016795 [Castanea mollissima]
MDTKATTSDHTDTGGALVEESPAPLEEAGTVRKHVSTAAMCSASQTVTVCHLAKLPVASQCPRPAGFCTDDSPALLEKVGCLAQNSAEADCLFSVGTRADELPITMGKADLEGDRALKHTVFWYSSDRNVLLPQILPHLLFGFPFYCTLVLNQFFTPLLKSNSTAQSSSTLPVLKPSPLPSVPLVSAETSSQHAYPSPPATSTPDISQPEPSHTTSLSGTNKHPTVT